MHLLFHCGIIAASPPAAIRTIVIKASFVSEHEMTAHLARNELFFDLVWHDFLLFMLGATLLRFSLYYSTKR